MPLWFASILERMMDFSNILNASIAASWMVLAVIALRFLLKNAPKWSHVALWGLVALRLLLPFSIESNLCLIPSTETVPQEILRYQGTQLQTPAYLDVVSNPNFPSSISIPAGHSVDYVQWQMVDMTFIWLAGIAALLLYTAVSYLSLRRKLATAVILRENIFQSEHVSSPFVLGIIKPRIYLPYHMDQETLCHVIAHEQAHIRRRDHWWKPLGFLLLTIHWFNPVMWLAYVLLCRDIELACDESVIRELGHEQRADYTQALVSCSVTRRTVAACPLAFGEVGVKERVKSVMNYRKPAFWVVVLSIVACTVVAVCFLTDPAAEREFPINGSNVSELDAALVAEKIAKAENVADGSQLYVNGDNFDLMFTPDFNWANDGAIRFFYMKNQKTYEAQLRMFHDDNKYFITDSSEWVEQKQIFLLIHYLEALKYMPQEAIRALSPDADGYSVIQVHDGTPSDYERVLEYSQSGVGDIDGWNIHLTVHPLHKVAGGGYNGHGDEVIHLFYDSQNSSSADSSVVKWFDYLNNPSAMSAGLTTELQEYPGVVFEFTRNEIIASKPFGASGSTNPVTLIGGMPIWNAYFTDLTGDGFPELCSTVSLGSGDIHNIVFVYDYAKGKAYDISDRGKHDFTIRFNEEDGCLYVDKQVHPWGELATSGRLAYEDNCIQILDSEADLITTASEIDPLDAAIRSAIIEINTRPDSPYDLCRCASFVLLDKEEFSITPVVGSTDHIGGITIYGLALYQGYDFGDNKLHVVEDSHTPVAITFHVKNGKYSLKEYWQPGDGSYYVPDIRDKFPDEIEEEALDTKKYIDVQLQECYAQAEEWRNSL